MDKRQRAQDAKRLLDDETLRQALNAVYSAHETTMLSLGATDEQVLEARRDYHALKRVEKQLRSYVTDGVIEQRKAGP